jgi:hypothetical protein
MSRARQQGRPARCADCSTTAQERAVRAAEAVVLRAWAEELLRQYDCMAVALDAARQKRRIASERLLAADILGEPRGISIAHAALVAAMDVHRASEAASERVRRALEAALDSLERMRRENFLSAPCQACDRGQVGTEPGAPRDQGFRRASPGGGGLEIVRRVLRQVGRAIVPRARGPRQV